MGTSTRPKLFTTGNPVVSGEVLVRVLVVLLNKKKVSSFKVQQAPQQAPTRNGTFYSIKQMILLSWGVLVVV